MRENGPIRYLLSGTLGAVIFLSRLPTAGVSAALQISSDEVSLARSVRFFPLAGIIIALPASLVAILLAKITPSHLLPAAIALAVMVIVTGALHEDGLADTADGFGGGKSTDEKLEIMRDSNIGTYGTLALMFSVFLRVVALSLLIGAGCWKFAAAFIATSALSRSAIVWIWANLPPARTAGGLSRDHGEPQNQDAQWALAIGVLAAIFLILPAFGLVTTTAMLLVAAGVSICWRSVCRFQVGGHTGDTLGAGQQICEVCLLTTTTILI